MEEKEKNLKSRKESDVLKYIEMVQEQQKELFKFCKKLMKKGYTEIPIEEIPTFQRLTAEDFFWYVKEVFRSNVPSEEKRKHWSKFLSPKVFQKNGQNVNVMKMKAVSCTYMGGLGGVIIRNILLMSSKHIMSCLTFKLVIQNLREEYKHFT